MIKYLAPLAIALALAGCSTTSQSDRALGGAAIGAGAGALVGAATGGGTGAVLTGAAIGGAGGAIVGAATTPKRCWARDEYGRRHRVACP
ncbi:MAG: bacteriocin [Phyllobacteriaceae bacterium]|nr:bacteriocin [Phyllobacteriaceae bacterium]